MRTHSLPMPSPRLVALALSVMLGGCVPELPAEAKAQEGASADECTDSADNDGDGAFDCDDSDCAGAPNCSGDTAATNAAPSGVSIAITPAAPGPDDALNCTIVTEAVDPDGDTVSYRYAWTLNSASAGLSEATVASSLTESGQVWTCTVTPNDGALDGTPASASVTIQQGNRAPSAPTVSIVPAAPTDDDAFNCVIGSESVDPDGDAVSYGYTWTVDGASAGISSAVVAADRTRAGELWACSVTGSDGELASAAAVASATILPVCDADGDGIDNAACGGDDCDDADASVFPRAGDTYGDGVDGDCDGMDCAGDTYDGVYYAVCPDEINWDDARSACVVGEHDGLASLHSAGEHDFVVSLVPSVSYHFWIGYSDGASEGTWQWEDGSTSSYTAWLPGEPSASEPGDDCANLSATNLNRWSDSDCDRTNNNPYGYPYGFICESR